MHPRTILAALTMALVAVVAIPGARVAGVTPRVLGFYRNEPVSANGEVASLALYPGAWVIVATATVLYDAPTQGMQCTLAAGGDFDAVALSNGTVARPIALAVVHQDSGPVTARLGCGTTAGADADVFNVRLIGYRVDRLTNRALPGDGSWTWGSGTPQAIAGWANGPLPVRIGAPSTLASLKLPVGRWFVLAKLYTQAGGTKTSSVDCQVQIGSTTQGFRGQRMRDQVGAGEASTMFGQHARRLTSPGVARLRCEASRPTTAGFLKVVAFRAGRLVAGEQRGGTGTPVVRMASDAGPITIPAGTTARRLVAQLSLPAGRWVLTAAATARNASGGPTGYLDCRLGSGIGATRVADVDLTAGGPHGRAPVMFLATSDTAGPTTARLRCRAGLTPLRISDVRIVAISTPSMQLLVEAKPAG